MKTIIMFLLIFLLFLSGCGSWKGISQETMVTTTRNKNKAIYMFVGHVKNNSDELLNITGVVVYVNGNKVGIMTSYIPSIIQPKANMPFRLLTYPVDITVYQQYSLQFLWSTVE